jgi:hypothetical protein
LDGFTQEAYKQYRIGGDVERVKAGLRMMMDYKRTHKLKKPFVNVYSITFSQVRPEMEQIKAFCDEIGVDQLAFRPDESNLDGTYSHKSPVKPMHECFWPYLSLQIDPDGSVYPCPVAHQMRGAKKKSYGNITTQTLDEIWNNDIYVETREYIMGKRDAASEHVGTIPCY